MKTQEEMYQALEKAEKTIQDNRLFDTVIVAGVNGEEFGDVPFNLEQWGFVLSTWRNMER